MVERAMKYDAMMVLSDLLSDEVVEGWAVPRERLDAFVADIQQAARQSGAVPFVNLDFLEFDDAVTSLIGMKLPSGYAHAPRQEGAASCDTAAKTRL